MDRYQQKTMYQALVSLRQHSQRPSHYRNISTIAIVDPESHENGRLKQETSTDVVQLQALNDHLRSFATLPNIEDEPLPHVCGGTYSDVSLVSESKLGRVVRALS